MTKSTPKNSAKTDKAGFNKDRRRKHHHWLVTVSYADGEKFGRVYTDKDKASRFALFCDAYGEGIARREVFDTLTAQLLVYADFIQAEADAGDPGFAKLARWNVPADLRNDSAVLVQQQGLLFGSS